MKKTMKRLIVGLIFTTLILGTSAGISTIAAGKKTEKVEVDKKGPLYKAITEEGFLDEDYYASNNPDVVEILGSDFKTLVYHFTKYGIFEGRQPNADFNVDAYSSAYEDLREAFNTPGKSKEQLTLDYYNHYITYGRYENREYTTVEEYAAAGGTVMKVGTDNADYVEIKPQMVATASSPSPGSNSGAGSGNIVIIITPPDSISGNNSSGIDYGGGSGAGNSQGSAGSDGSASGNGNAGNGGSGTSGSGNSGSGSNGTGSNSSGSNSNAGQASNPNKLPAANANYSQVALGINQGTTNKCSHGSTYTEQVVAIANESSNGYVSLLCDLCKSKVQGYNVHAYKTYKYQNDQRAETPIDGWLVSDYDGTTVNQCGGTSLSLISKINKLRYDNGKVSLNWAGNLQSFANTRAIEVVHYANNKRPWGVDFNSENQEVKSEIICVSAATLDEAWSTISASDANKGIMLADDISSVAIGCFHYFTFKSTSAIPTDSVYWTFEFK